jgi:hypothetical protein
MERLKVFLVRAAICFLLPQLLLGGCTLIGFGIGALMDSSSPKGGEVSIKVLDDLEAGTTIAVTLRDSRRIEGDYVSIREEDSVRYAEEFVNALVEWGGQGRVPLPGNRVMFAYWNARGLKEGGRFRGVDMGTMVVDQPSRRAPVSDLGMLVFNDSSQADLHVFSSLVSDRRLPWLRKGILLKINGEATEVPMVDVVRVEVVGGDRNAKWFGLAAGALVDGVVAIILVHSTAESCEKSDCGQWWCSKKEQR